MQDRGSKEGVGGICWNLRFCKSLQLCARLIVVISNRLQQPTWHWRCFRVAMYWEEFTVCTWFQTVGHTDSVSVSTPSPQELFLRMGVFSAFSSEEEMNVVIRWSVFFLLGLNNGQKSLGVSPEKMKKKDPWLVPSHNISEGVTDVAVNILITPQCLTCIGMAL